MDPSPLIVGKPRRSRFCNCPACGGITRVERSHRDEFNSLVALTTCVHCFLCFDARGVKTWLSFDGAKLDEKR